MPPISPDRDQLIRQVVRSCGQQAVRMATEKFDVFQKGPGDFVTTIDAALDQRLSAFFSDLFPDDGVITEEDGESRKKFNTQFSRLWCIDPLDGTEDFIHGRQDYAVMVGLLQSYQPIAGWVGAPTYDQIYYGGPDWGLFQVTADAAPVSLNISEPKPPTKEFCPIVIGHRDQEKFGDAIAQVIPEVQFYSLGSFGLKVIEVVLGRAGLYLYFNGRVKLWDTTGPLALAKAAGLTCCDLEGRPLSSAPNEIDLETLAHKQPIIIGWPHYVELLRPKLEKAVASVVDRLY